MPKYSIPPYWTKHALERWDERTPRGSCAPERAWAAGHDITVLRHHDGLTDCAGSNPDEARVFYGTADGQDYGAVFIVKHQQNWPRRRVITVYKLGTLHHPELRAYLCDLRQYIENSTDQPDPQEATA